MAGLANILFIGAHFVWGAAITAVAIATFVHFRKNRQRVGGKK